MKSALAPELQQTNSVRPVFSRRAFLQGGLGAFTLAVTSQGLVTSVWAQQTEPKYGAEAMPGGTVDDPLVFVSIAANGIVTIITHRSEMGTGIRTSLPMVVADEMEADWARVQIEQAEGDEARYGNQNTDGSRSMRHFLTPMRRVGAAARQMLEATAAARWSVPVSEVKAVNHEVVHLRSSRRLGYGELAEDAARQPAPAAQTLQLKSPEDFRYIGKGQIHMVDLQAIGTGQAVYGFDMQLPDMVYAVVARPPVLGGKVRRVDSSKALTVPGVLKIVEIPAFQGAHGFQPLGGIAVVARNTWAALQGRSALEIEWDDGPNASYDSVTYRQMLEDAARRPGNVMRDQGDVAQAWNRAHDTERVAAEYYIPHLAHASMEPPVATVRLQNGRAEVWAPVQDPQTTRNAVARRLKTGIENVRVNVLLLGGAFGRKSKCDFVDEAVIVAQAMPEATPVKVVWTREDDLHHDYFHTVAAERLEAVVDAQGKVQSWLHRSAAPTIASLFSQDAQSQQVFEAGMGKTNVPYQIPHLRVEVADKIPAHTRIGWFRSVLNIPHVFAGQSFLAELAHHAGKDHKQFALDLIGPARRIDPRTIGDNFNYRESPEIYVYDTGRLRGVIEAACQGAQWGRTLPPGHGLGLAFNYAFTSYTATVIEVRVDDQGRIEVLSMDMAMDCGPQINPERIRSQVEGGAIMGLSLALTSEITFAQGRVQQTNFHDYEVLRHPATPPVIRTHLVNDNYNDPPGGVGEPAVPPVAPALCNAIFAATGKRIRSLPVRRVV